MKNKESYRIAKKGCLDDLHQTQFGFRKSFQLNTNEMEVNYQDEGHQLAMVFQFWYSFHELPNCYLLDFHQSLKCSQNLYSFLLPFKLHFSDSFFEFS